MKSIFIILLLVMLLTSGCVGPTMRTYRGDRLPKSEIAVVKGIYAVAFPIIPAYWFIDIYTVDGKPLEATQVEVLPGWHELVVRDVDTGLGLGHIKSYRMSFNAEAGHGYKIRRRWDSLRKIVNITIVDVNTGAIISKQPF